MRFLRLLLCPLLALHPLWAQANSDTTALHIYVVDDPGPALTQSTSVKGYVLQVTNSLGAPVVGAAVALRLPEDGATGHFSNGLRAWVSYSDPAGIARFPVIQWEDRAGALQLHVTVAKGPAHNGLTITQQVGQVQPSVSVVSVPMQASAVVAPAMKPAAPAEKTETAAATPSAQTGTSFQNFETPAPAKPALPNTPQVAQTTTPDAVSKPLADITPPDGPAMNISRSGTSAPPGGAHPLTPNPTAASGAKTEPTVSITNSPSGAGHDGHNKKWFLLVAIGAGAGVGAVMALRGHGGSNSNGSGSATGVSVGTPTITVGH